MFYSALNDAGRAGFVMPNSASEARASESEIRQKMIEDKCVDVIVAVGTNMFYNVTLPCTLWFLDNGKKKTPRSEKVLFIDARHIYRQVDRAQRDWSPNQMEFIANIVRLYRNEKVNFSHMNVEEGNKIHEIFGENPVYADVIGLCKAASIEEIALQKWALSPGRYVGVVPGERLSDIDFRETLNSLNEELCVLNEQAIEMDKLISKNIFELLN